VLRASLREVKLLLSPYQIINYFKFSNYIDFAIHLDYIIYMYNKITHTLEDGVKNSLAAYSP
jgi:hypothetical protein